MCVDASLKKAVRSANRKDFRAFGNQGNVTDAKKSGSSGRGSSGSEEKKKKDEKKQAQPYADKKKEGGAAPEGDRRRKNYPCRFLKLVDVRNENNVLFCTLISQCLRLLRS